MAHGGDSARRQLNHNLPYSLTSFVGRGIELAELKRLLQERRLVTLTGTGGAGKTRLAVEAAATLAQDFPDGAFLVDLAPLSRPELLAETVARVLGLDVLPDRPLLDALAGFVCGRGFLLVLDNCEHLLADCARLAATLLAACPDLCILATSREPLGVAGECTFRVPLLSVPGPGALPSADELLGFEAIQLFVDRAQLADPTFALTEANAASVAQVCLQLDGIPLALELAATTLRAMPISELAARLDQRFRLLTAGSRNVLPRHQTLKALLDWGYALFDEHEQRVFRRLATFPGDWTLDAAESICGADSGTAEVLGVLVQLVNKSVVDLDHATGRYRMLETIHLHARGKLEEAGEQEGIARRHFNWYLGFVEQGASQLDSPGQQQWFACLESEQANLRAALSWAIEGGWADEGARLALELWKFWIARAHHAEARCWLEEILALGKRVPLAPRVRARLLGALGFLAHTMNDFEQASRYHNEALSIWRALGDRAGIARALNGLGWQQFEAMDLKGARRYAEESLAVARQAGDAAAVAAALYLSALASVEAGWFEGLIPALEECLSIWRALGVLPELGQTLGALARVEQRLGNLGRAGDLMLEGLRLQVSLADYGGLIGYLVLMVYFEFGVGTPPPGPEQRGHYQPLGYLADGRLLNGPAEATRVLGVMGAWQDKVIGGPPLQWNAMVVPLCEKLRAELGEAAFEREFSAGRALGFDDIVALAEKIVQAVQAVPSPARAERTALRAPAASIAATASPASPALPRRPAYPAQLTAREVEVLRLVAAGLTNRQAAERLVVTPRTINAHLTSIYGKTGVSSRTAAVRFAVDHGLA